VLRGTEPLAFQLAFAFALLDAGRAPEAAKEFRSLAAKGNPAAYLKGNFAKIGPQLFAAYVAYRTGTGAARQQACADLVKLEADLGAKGKELVASCWEAVAYDQWRAGAPGAALKAIATADKAATTDALRRRLAMDRAALALGKDKQQELEALAGNPPESLVHLGIVYDLLDKPREAYDTWQKEKAHGDGARDLQKWLDAKKRIYGF